MSYETLREGWVGWNLPAWIQSDRGVSLQQCRVRDLSRAAARLEIERAAVVPDRFVLHLTQSGSLALNCNVVRRGPAVVEVNYELM
jgi:hypothetical protein